jgi:trans-2,3-dihydro-3-hydroxyanthranilate isomerase
VPIRVTHVLSYDVVDVFTDRPFAGNPLAVVRGAENLDDDQLLAIAREFNLSETTFPAETAGEYADGYSVRIFTPGGEIPFAGHPTLGTAWVLRQHGRLAAGSVVQRCGAGDIEVLVAEQPEGPVRLRATPRDLAGPVEALAAAKAVGLTDDDVAGEAYVAGCGLSWAHLPVRVDSLSRCRPAAGFDEVVAARDGVRDPVAGVNVYAVATRAGGDQADWDGADGSGLSVRSRVFCPDVGVTEDPATGSAAVGLGIVLVATGALPDGGSYTISQGTEMGRPSTLHARVDAGDGRATRCEVGGGVVSAAAGTIAVPG